MNENNEDGPSARESLCWNCKHGLCVKDIELHSSYEKAPLRTNDIFTSEASEEEPDLAELVFPSTKIRTICFWKPEHTLSSPPIMISKIEECNRFEAK